MRRLFVVPLITLRTPVLVALVALLALCTTGCAGLSGNALYTYERTSAAECKISIDSGRVMSAGISISLRECDVTVDAGKLEKGGNTVKDVVDLLGILKAPVPK